ncbi:MAG TPA: SCO family protein [Longimicrobiales bacterium]|nr:SCO family protein [Longimicrobiales bacterium]
MTATMRTARLAAALTLMTLLLTSCREAPAANTAGQGAAAIALAGDAQAADSHAGHGSAPAPAEASEFSIYDLESAWQDQQGATLALRDLQSRPRVIAMVYTSCAYACPRILKDMKRIEGELRAEGIDAGYVMVSLDPERDTPARLAEYAASTLLDPQDWTLLTGTQDGILELATLLGVRYRRVSETDFEHSNVITLLDGDGRIVHRQVGLNAEPAALIQAARSL